MEFQLSSEEKEQFSPDEGFNLIGIDPFEAEGNRLYLVRHFDRYQDALIAKKDKKNINDFFILYKDSSGNTLCR